MRLERGHGKGHTRTLRADLDSAAIFPHSPSVGTKACRRRPERQTMTKLSSRKTDSPCVTLIGMAGAGKTTIGRLLSARLGWAHVDTDHLIEAYFGRPLQGIFDDLGRERFIKAEEEVVSRVALKRTVISTGGSVVYGPEAVEQLKLLGPVVHLEPGLKAARTRVGDASGRGLAIADGQSFSDLYNERKPLYEAAANLTVTSSGSSPEECAEEIVAWLAEQVIL